MTGAHRHPVDGRASLRATLPANLRVTLRATTVAAVLCASLASPGLLASATPAPSAVGLPSLGGAGEMSLGQERKLGDSIAKSIWRDPDLLQDPLLQAYIDGLFAAVIGAARERGEIDADMAERFAWRAFLSKDRNVNAFALPGGYFGVHAGLIKMTATRDELASVIAHEISHVTQRHISRSLAKQSEKQPLMLVAMVLGLFAARNNPDALNAVAVGTQAASAQMQLNFSRDMEREADRVGLGLLTQAGFEPDGMRSMFDRLQNATRLADNGAFPYLRSHPLSSERMADVQSRLQLDGTSAAQTTLHGPRAVAPASPAWAQSPHLSPAMHRLMSARAKAMGDNNLDQLRSISTEGQDATVQALNPQARPAALYASMLAHHRLREFDDAWQRFEALKTMVASDSIEFVVIKIAALDVLRDQTQARGPTANWANATAMAQALADQNRNWRPAVLAASAAWIAASKADLARELLQSWLAEHPQDAPAWRMLGKAWELQGRTLRGVEAVAQAHRLELDAQGALDRLVAAQQMVRQSPADHVDASIIDTKARELALLLREQAVQDRFNR